MINIAGNHHHQVNKLIMNHKQNFIDWNMGLQNDAQGLKRAGRAGGQTRLARHYYTTSIALCWNMAQCWSPERRLRMCEGLPHLPDALKILVTNKFSLSFGAAKVCGRPKTLNAETRRVRRPRQKKQTKKGKRPSLHFLLALLLLRRLLLLR